MLTRSLETLTLRMERQNATAQKVAAFLNSHPKIGKVYYLGLIAPEDPQYSLYQKQYTAPGAMLSFDVMGGEPAAYKFLNNLHLVKLAVSLGSTESLAQHPATMTHVSTPKEVREHVGITESMVRLSVGVEDADDLIFDLSQALELV
jgi:methionine-gamma-lyase